MEQAMVSFSMDVELKANMERVCKEMGMGIATAFTIFASRVTKDRRIPFEVAAEPDPFYSEENLAQLRKAIADANAGRLTEHELIEVYDDQALAG